MLAVIFSGTDRDMKVFVTILIVLTIVSCGRKNKLEYADIAGTYTNGIDSTNYNDFILRTDSTYSGHQSWHWGDAMIGYAGRWEIIDDTIVLYRGWDFSDKLKIENPNDTKSDTLTLDVKGLLTYDKNIRLSVNKIDLPITGGRVKIYKPDFWKQLYSNYDGYLLHSIDIRIKNGYATIDSHETGKDMIISFTDKPGINISADSILCKYFKKDSVLYSSNEHFSIEKNNLRKGGE
jgi:hypothetical protein